MKKVFLLSFLLIAGFTALAAQEWEEFEGFIIGEVWNKGASTLSGRLDDLGIIFSGSADKDCAGFVVISDYLGLEGKSQLMLQISGIDRTDVFDLGKLLKLELNNTVAKTIGNRGMNMSDPAFLNARNGEYVFALKKPEDIIKIELVFYKCTLRNLSVRMFIK